MPDAEVEVIERDGAGYCVLSTDPDLEAFGATEYEALYNFASELLIYIHWGKPKPSHGRMEWY